MTSVVDIVNESLLIIGAQAEISNLEDGSEEANAASILYTPKTRAVLRSAHWNAARFGATPLSLLKAAANTPENPNGAGPIPPMPWLYSYSYPPDCLAVRFILPLLTTGTITPPLTTAPTSVAPVLANYAVPFAVGTDTNLQGNRVRVILTNQCKAQAVYTGDVSQNPDLWDPHLQDGVVTTLGIWLSNSLARNRAQLGDMVKLAGDIVGAARVSDGNEGVTSQNRQADWITARGAGVYGPGAMLFGGWSPLALPGAVI